MNGNWGRKEKEWNGMEGRMRKKKKEEGRYLMYGYG
jgi:hypothetical protein